MNDYSKLIDTERLSSFNAALRLAIAERTGVEPAHVNVLDLTADLQDVQRAHEIFKACWVE